MNILVASSEVVPFAKTGGLADVCGSLPQEVAALGHSVSVIMPAYRHIQKAGLEIEPTGKTFDIPIGNHIMRGALLKSKLPGGQVPIYFVQQDEYFDRAELYRADGEDYADNCQRFVFFSRAVLEAIRLLDLKLEVIHCNDWQTGLIPAILAMEYPRAVGYEHISTLLTIHNMAYQGAFPPEAMSLTGLDDRLFNWRQMEFYGQLNLLKTGLAFSDAITTVSPTYAEEIQSAPHGCGLEGMLSHRSSVLTGILNGVDYTIWNPEQDDALAETYSVKTWKKGKPSCKSALQSEVSLPQSQAPLIGIIGRMADQKGWDLVAEVMRNWLETEDVQWVVLGTGEPHYQQMLARLAEEYAHKLAVRLEFSATLAHRIEAGADLFLMPSAFEPCGLNQMYSLKYGTVPVVRATGGLADTITDATPASLEANLANGFSFEEYSVEAFESALRRACDMYRNEPENWEQLVTTGMKQDWSWSQSAARYVDLYSHLASQKKPAGS